MKTISEILENNTTLAKLIKKTQSTKNLATIFKSMLDVNLTKNCTFANFEGTVLTVLVTNPSWATKLRYAIPDIIKNLRTQPEFATITNIRYIVDQQGNQYKLRKKQQNLSGDNETLWQETLTKLREKYSSFK